MITDNNRRINMDVCILLNNIPQAMILSQIDYWLDVIEKNPNLKQSHFHDNRLWVYKTYENLQAELPNLSISTINRSLQALKKSGILLCGTYNKMGYDRTCWYSIDYDRLQTLINTHKVKLSECNNSNCTNAIVQDELTNTIYYTDNTYKENIKCSRLSQAKDGINYGILEKQIKTICEEENYSCSDDIVAIIVDFYKTYEKTFKEPHPPLAKETMRNVIDRLVRGSDMVDECDYDIYDELIRDYFRTGYNSDYHIMHFMTDGIRDNLFYKAFY